MSDFLGIDTQGIPEIIQAMQDLPDAAADDGVEASNEYIINIMRSYAPYQYVDRKQVPWASEKQRRYVMMMISKGNMGVPYQRTQGLKQGWKAVGSGKDQIVVNEVPYAGYVMDNPQARRFSLMGWDTMMERLSDRIDRIVVTFEAGVSKALRRLGLD